MYDPRRRDEEDSDSDWDVEHFEGTPQEYLEVLARRKAGEVEEEVEVVEEWKPDIIEASHCWLPESLDESKLQSTIISKDRKKLELVIETRFCICGDQLMSSGIYNWKFDLDFILGNVFAGVTAYQSKNGGNPMQNYYVHGWDMFGTKWQSGERGEQDWSTNDVPANTIHPYYTFKEPTYAWTSGTVLSFKLNTYESSLTLSWDGREYVMSVPDIETAPLCPFLFFYGTELTALIS